MSSVDPAAVKAGQRASWDAISVGWESAWNVFDRGAASVTTELLRLGGVRPGQRVLDVATGLGEPALSAARAVGPDGQVVGVDISQGMLAIARRRATALGLSNVDFVVGDVESVDLADHSFDVALSRWGLMFAVDHVAAFRQLVRLLVPGGVLAAAIWGPPESVPMLALGYRVLVERLALPEPPPGTPGPFSMSDPRKVADELVAAGLLDVSVTEFVVPFEASAQEYADFNRDVLPPDLLEKIRERDGSVEDPGTWGAIADAAQRYAGGSGSGGDGPVLALPSTALCVRAVAP